jgi:hypothetical protein
MPNKGIGMFRKLSVACSALYLASSITPSLADPTLCVVITGVSKEQDWNDAFKDKKFYHSPPQIAGHPCKLFPSWEKARQFLDEDINSSNNVPSGTPSGTPTAKPQLFIAQGAHGGPKGNAYCDEGMIPGQQVMLHLLALSKRFKVAGSFESCYSGDLIRSKLIRDRLGDAHHATDDICIVTESLMGRSARGPWSEFYEGVKPGDTPEDILKYAKQGMISSAAWSGSGVVDYLVKQEVQQGLRTLQNLNQVMMTAPASSCGILEGKLSSKLCLHPKIHDQNFYLFANTMDSLFVTEADFQRYKTELTMYKKMIDDLMKDKRFDSSGKNANLESYKCREEVSVFFSEVEPLIKQTGKLVAQELFDRLFQFYKSNRIPSCHKAQAIVKEMVDKATASGVPIMGDASLTQTLMGHEFISSFILSLGSFGPAFIKFEQNKEALHELLNQSSSNGGSSTDQDERFLKDLLSDSSEKECLPENISKEKILASIFGQQFLEGDLETIIYPGGATEKIPVVPIVELSTAKVLSGFAQASVYLEKMEHPEDVARRKACRDFKF